MDFLQSLHDLKIRLSGVVFIASHYHSTTISTSTASRYGHKSIRVLPIEIQ